MEVGKGNASVLRCVSVPSVVAELIAYVFGKVNYEMPHSNLIGTLVSVGGKAVL
jgi:hypothetical protein